MTYADDRERTTRLEPLPESMILAVLSKDELRAGGPDKIQLPDDYDGAPNYGEILKLGAVAREKTGLAPGRRVFYNPVHGFEVTSGDGKVVIISYEDLIAAVEA